MTTPERPRAPRAFSVDEAVIVDVVPHETERATNNGGTPSEPSPPPSYGLPTRSEVSKGIRWGALLVSAFFSLAVLAIGVWFTRFISVTLAREDWVGWLATGLLVLGLLALAVIVLKELFGLARLARLGRFRREVEQALRTRDITKERSAARRLVALMRGRPDAAWGLARFREHQGDIHDPGKLLALADREIVAPLDREARRIVLASSKRVSVVTALSPIALITVGFVLVENVRMLRQVATLYGGQPGLTGALRLGSLVVGHLIAAGGVALTDDLLGQFLGQDLVRRLSRRLGEGLFNGALTARIGATAITVIRPLPFLDAPPVRVRDIVKELFRKAPASEEKSEPADTEKK